ncbi:hypothetical protein ACFXDF_33935, partial [Streptomyces sp. NPDC059426]|uniref:hypothetical protein n=1 Tax=Streptomyces sp. NPDC059426 TaxID=3346827 RepID=UPI0036A5D709
PREVYCRVEGSGAGEAALEGGGEAHDALGLDAGGVAGGLVDGVAVLGVDVGGVAARPALNGVDRGPWPPWR